jgi:FixJ family two-component response regulator
MSRPGATSAAEAMVLIVDDDESVRESLSSLFRSVGHKVALFENASELLGNPVPEGPSCLVLDIRLPGLSGLDFQAKLAEIGNGIPVIFMTGHGDIPMSVRAMKAGAVDFLAKPFRDQDMLDAVTAALERDRSRRMAAAATAGLAARYRSLTPREQEIMGHVTAGLMNKQVAARVGLSEITVKIHRGQVMRKMEAKSLADLVVMAQALGLHPPG